MARKFVRLASPLLAATLLFPVSAMAQGWFMPKSNDAAPAAASAHVAHHSAHSTVAPMAPTGGADTSAVANSAAPEEQAPQIPLPPVPDLPSLPKVAEPPKVVVGVLGVPEVMRNSDAAKAVEKIIGARRDKLNADAQKELSAEREMGEQIATQGAHMSAEQKRTKEQALRDRSMKAQKDFRQRGQVIQQAAQYALSQIERTLIAVIRQVAESHSMNLVLHRAQVALNVNEFDITNQVTTQLNKVLPSVQVPPEGVTVQDFVKQHPELQSSGKSAH